MDAVYARHKPDFHFHVFIRGDRNFDSILLFKEALTFPFFLFVPQFAQTCSLQYCPAREEISSTCYRFCHFSFLYIFFAFLKRPMNSFCKASSGSNDFCVCSINSLQLRCCRIYLDLRRSSPNMTTEDANLSG